ncbi:hypothetical protein G3M48_001350, partial [Beauveria asiatica]
DMTAPVRSSASLALVAGQCLTVREDHLDSYVMHNATAVQQQLMQQDTQHMPSETWCFNEHYPAPETEQFCEPQAHVTVAVAPLDQLPAYGYGIFDLYGGQIEFVDLSMQSSGCRIASMYTARPKCDACVKRSESCQYTTEPMETQQQSNQRRIRELEQEQSSKEQRIRELEMKQISYGIPLECIKTAEQPSEACLANSTKHHWSSIREEPATPAGKRPQTEVEK